MATSRRLGVYVSKPAQDVGLGMRPDLTGLRLGTEFALTCLRFTRAYLPAAFQLTFAASNLRAVRVPRVRVGRLRGRRLKA